MKGDMVLRVPAECICGYMEAEFASAGTSEHRAIDPPLGWGGGSSVWQNFTSGTDNKTLQCRNQEDLRWLGQLFLFTFAQVTLIKKNKLALLQSLLAEFSNCCRRGGVL